MKPIEKFNPFSAQYSAKLNRELDMGFKDGWIDTRS